MGVTFRPIRKTDNPFLAKLVKSVFVEYKAHHHEGTIFSDPTTDNLYELFQTPRSICWIASIEDEIVGCCGIYPTKELPDFCAELVKFYVLHESRGKGIGNNLLLKCQNSATELGYTQLYLESLPEFQQAVGMYKKYGFKHLDKPLGDSGHFGCTIWMEKN